MVAEFQNLPPNAINALAQLAPSQKQFNKPLLELMQDLTVEQLSKIENPVTRQTLVANALRIALTDTPESSESLSLLLKLPEQERLANTAEAA